MATATKTDPPAEEPAVTRKTRDPEAQAIDEINRAMARLTDRASHDAVVAWFCRRHGWRMGWGYSDGPVPPTAQDEGDKANLMDPA